VKNSRRCSQRSWSETSVQVINGAGKTEPKIVTKLVMNQQCVRKNEKTTKKKRNAIPYHQIFNRSEGNRKIKKVPPTKTGWLPERTREGDIKEDVPRVTSKRDGRKGPTNLSVSTERLTRAVGVHTNEAFKKGKDLREGTK